MTKTIFELDAGQAALCRAIAADSSTCGRARAAIILLSSLANWKRALAVSVSSAVVGYVVFLYFFNTRFPSGPIEDWLKGLL